MKRNRAWIALLMALCMVLALVACSSKRALTSECLAGHLLPRTNQGPTFRERE